MRGLRRKDRQATLWKAVRHEPTMPTRFEEGWIMVIQIVRMRSGLSDADVRRVMEERAPDFRRVAGLQQKYFCRDGKTGEFAGVYVWDSEESMLTYRQSELARTTPGAYQIQGQPRIETLDVLFPLRAEEPAAAGTQAGTGT
jgi:heme-degrading monooxygenase HmoA